MQVTGPKILEEIYRETGLKIDIITGQEEANIIYETHIAENLTLDKSYLYIDVGGGSTEITLLFSKPYYLQRIIQHRHHTPAEQ